MSLTTWRNYKIGANGTVGTFYAPDLDSAFRLARIKWPSATTLKCLGSEP